MSRRNGGGGIGIALQFWLAGILMIVVGAFAWHYLWFLVPLGILTMFLGFVFGERSSG